MLKYMSHDGYYKPSLSYVHKKEKNATKDFDDVYESKLILGPLRPFGRILLLF